MVIACVDRAGNLLVAGSATSTDLLREIASEVGFEMDEEGASVIDHLNFDASDEGQVGRSRAVATYIWLSVGDMNFDTSCAFLEFGDCVLLRGSMTDS